MIRKSSDFIARARDDESLAGVRTGARLGVAADGDRRSAIAGHLARRFHADLLRGGTARRGTDGVHGYRYCAISKP